MASDECFWNRLQLASGRLSRGGVLRCLTVLHGRHSSPSLVTGAARILTLLALRSEIFPEVLSFPVGTLNTTLKLCAILLEAN